MIIGAAGTGEASWPPGDSPVGAGRSTKTVSAPLPRLDAPAGTGRADCASTGLVVLGGACPLAMALTGTSLRGPRVSPALRRIGKAVNKKN
jgi:hypothetical protein